MSKYLVGVLLSLACLVFNSVRADPSILAVCDGDNDGFANSGPLCGGIDCNDDDPTIYPGAPEIKDGKDNDCDFDGKADEGLINSGDLVLTEILYDPSLSPEEQFEWFELFNPTDRPINLRTWTITDQPGISQETVIVGAKAIIQPRDFVVLCRNSDSSTNGGVTCGYHYALLDLNNISDELILNFDGVVVDEVWYDETSGWPPATSGSLNLDPDAVAGDNNQPGNWCNSPNGPPELSNGDDATPGDANVSCADPVANPQVMAVHPDNGISSGGTSLRIVGAGFTGVTDMLVGGSSCSTFTVDTDHLITCVSPTGPDGPGDITVFEGATSDTLSSAFTFTRPATFSPELVDSAHTNRPDSVSFVIGTTSEVIYGRVLEFGITGTACPFSREYAHSQLIAEVGYGNLWTDPASDGSWLWFPAFCEGQVGGGEDEFFGTLTSKTAGTYSYCYRFSVDGGLTWNYSDLDGTANGFSTEQTGTMTVLNAPNNPDVDGDGFLSIPEGGEDCDDRDPTVYPGAPEIRDGKDNDCDFDGKADENLIQPDDLVITEILYDSSQIPDENFEWFELFNPTNRPINMRTWTITDQPGTSQDTVPIIEDVLIMPRDFFVFCRNATPSLNGGVTCGHQYSLLTLGNISDELILDFDGVVVDEVWYDEGAGWQSATSGSLNLDPDAVDGDNNLPANWCNSPNGPPELSNGDDATPGAANVSCIDAVADPVITAVHPDNGIDSGGTSLRIVGAGFTGVTDVSAGGSSCSTFTVDSNHVITCISPPGSDGPADITVSEGAAGDTLSGHFIYTRPASFPSELVDSARTDRPATVTFLMNTWSGAIYGRVQEGGITGTGCPADMEYAPGVLIAEIGYGNLGTDPTQDGSWTWFPSFCDSQPGGGEDEFLGIMTATISGTYSYCYRFSVDGGLTWNYADLDGTANGFSTAQLGVMTVSACIDADGDTFGDEACGGADCDDVVAETYPGAEEVNDGLDNQCPGDGGYGLVDEIPDTTGFHNPADRDEYSWPPQTRTTLYEVLRSTTPDFSGSCISIPTISVYFSDADVPDPGLGFHYLVHTLEPYAGSLGRDSSGTERIITCP